MIYFVHKNAEMWRRREATVVGLPDSRPEWFRQGTDVWIAQTWLRLRRSGLDVSLVDDIVPGEVCIAHFDHLSRLREPWRCFLVAVRADHSPVHTACLSIVQNPRLAGTSHLRHFLPHWPQPGLMPRDTARGERLERVAYLGRPGHLMRWLTSDDGTARLSHLGVRMVAEDERWWDYTHVDAVLAVRQGIGPTFLATKPASKLANAWIAGCPAILGHEPALRACRRSELDYLEVRTPQEVLSAVSRLRTDASLYSRMVSNGLSRAKDVDVRAVSLAWGRFLESSARPRWLRWRRGLLSRPRWSKARHALLGWIQAVDRLRFRQMAFGSVLRRSPAPVDPVSDQGADVTPRLRAPRGAGDAV